MRVFDIVIERLLKQLEGGVIPWKQTWTSGYPQNIVSKKPYNGINQLLLANAPTPYFISYKQCRAMYHNVNKGATPYMVVYYKITEQITDDGKKDKHFFMRYYNVFNVADTDIDLDEQAAIPKDMRGEAIVEGYEDCPLIVGGEPAYLPSHDLISMPDISSFRSAESYYSALFHEMIHSTGHSSRLKRKQIAEGTYHHNKQERSEEELVAEIGCSFLRNAANIMSIADDENTVAYCQSWLVPIKKDKRILERAIYAANKAAKYILGETYEDNKDS